MSDYNRTPSRGEGNGYGGAGRAPYSGQSTYGSGASGRSSGSTGYGTSGRSSGSSGYGASGRNTGSAARGTASGRSGASGTGGTERGADSRYGGRTAAPSGRNGASGHNSASGRSSSAGYGTFGRNTGSAARGTASGRSSASGHGSGSGRGGYSSQRGGGRHKRRKNLDITQILLIVIGVLVVILCAALIGKSCHGRGEDASTEASSSLESVSGQVMVNGVDIAAMTQEEAKKAILDAYGWSMKVKYGEKEAAVGNLLEDNVNQLLEELYASELKPGETYAIPTDNLLEAAKAEAALIAGNWNMVAKNGGISGYNKETGKFEFTSGTTGRVIDQDALAAAMVDAIQKEDYSAVLEAQVKEVSPELTADQLREKYKTISTYTTTTTSNSNRNENIRLAVQALNGTIVNPGQEFSFNNTTGERTEAKGYKPATAYLNGEIVQEPGGGVCQVSSTLYNAVVFAGLKSTERHAHSYEPSYVTPGEDAAVSYGGPDFKFVNNSDYPVAVKASFSSSDRKLTISIYGVPILKDGVKIRMVSEKTSEIDPPAPVYEEDQTLQLDQQVEAKAATPGSRWTTDLVTYENDKEVSREFFHNSSYRGKAAIIKRNTSGVVVTTGGESESAGESAAESLTESGGETAGPGSGIPDPSQSDEGTSVPGGEVAGTETPDQLGPVNPAEGQVSPGNPVVPGGPADL